MFFFYATTSLSLFASSERCCCRYLMPIRAIVTVTVTRPSIVTFAKNLLLRRVTPASRFVHHSRPVVASIESPKWGSKNKKDKRKVPLHRTIEMSLSPESEAILAPLRAKVKEQVRVFYFVTFLAFLLNTWNAEALTFASTVIHGRHEKSPCVEKSS